MDHQIFYQDRKYLLLRADKRNIAIVNRSNYAKFSLGDASLIGYFPSLKEAIMHLIELRAEDHLLSLVRDKPFSDLEVLVEEYIKKSLTITHNILTNLKVK